MGNNGFTWEGLGVPDFLIPSPFPFLPIPKEIINRLEGLSPYRVYVMRELGFLEEVGRVWAGSRDEAEEAAENLAGGPGVMAIEVEKEKLGIWGG